MPHFLQAVGCSSALDRFQGKSTGNQFFFGFSIYDIHGVFQCPIGNQRWQGGVSQLAESTEAYVWLLFILLVRPAKIGTAQHLEFGDRWLVFFCGFLFIVYLCHSWIFNYIYGTHMYTSKKITIFKPISAPQINRFFAWTVVDVFLLEPNCCTGHQSKYCRDMGRRGQPWGPWGAMGGRPGHSG